MRFFTWDDPALDPVEAGVDPSGGLEAVLAGDPIHTRRESRLHYQWFTPRLDFLPASRWVLEATAKVTLPPGEYSLRTISDGSVRVWVDGELAVDHWQPHGASVDYGPISPGAHTIRVRYVQIEGWTEIRTEIVRGSNRSTGSAGPH